MKHLNTNDCPIYALMRGVCPEDGTNNCCQYSAFGDDDECCAIKLMKWLAGKEHPENILADVQQVFEKQQKSE